jgi:hypothetical protein
MPCSNTHGNGEYVTKHARKLKEREVELLGWNLGRQTSKTEIFLAYLRMRNQGQLS